MTDRREVHDRNGSELRTACECDLRAERTRTGKHIVMHGTATIEVAESQIGWRANWNSRETGEPAARLQIDLQQHGVRHSWPARLFVVPIVLRHVVFADDASTDLNLARLSVDLGDPRHEVIRRSRQSRTSTMTVEDAVHRTEHGRRFAPSASQQRFVVAAHVADSRELARRCRQAHQVRSAVHRPIGDQLQTESLAVE